VVYDRSGRLPAGDRIVMARKKRTSWGGLRRPRLLAAAAIPVAIPLLLAVAKIQPESAPRNMPASMVTPPLRYTDLSAAPSSELPEHSVVLTFEKDDTLDAILVAGGVGRRDSALLTQEFAKSIDVRRLRPGHLVRFHYDLARAVDAVQMKVTGWGEIEALRNGEGSFTVTPRPAEQQSVSSVVSAEVDSSLWEALRRSGEQPAVVQQLVDIFQWDIDFFELQKGDSFSFVVDKKFAGPDLVGYGPVLAARFTHKNVTYEAFRHEFPDGRAGYYARAGTPLRKQFLRAPLKFSRITSGFSKRRFHPVLHYFRAHHGVDYGAPTGTPVMTTADGVVVEARYKRGEGNIVRIKHTSRIETSYLHLSKFAKDVKPGKRVVQGDVIGYVGATGLATGPHLDYRVRDNGTWLDPLKLKSITPDPLGGDSLRRFRADVARLAPRQATSATEQIATNDSRRRALF
jgi:murein DD-endopeptidase MepM/ murein hydrolase activator NlpD